MELDTDERTQTTISSEDLVDQDYNDHLYFTQVQASAVVGMVDIISESNFSKDRVSIHNDINSKLLFSTTTATASIIKPDGQENRRESVDVTKILDDNPSSEDNNSSNLDHLSLQHETVANHGNQANNSNFSLSEDLGSLTGPQLFNYSGVSLIQNFGHSKALNVRSLDPGVLSDSDRAALVEGISSRILSSTDREALSQKLRQHCSNNIFFQELASVKQSILDFKGPVLIQSFPDGQSQVFGFEEKLHLTAPKFVVEADNHQRQSSMLETQLLDGKSVSAILSGDFVGTDAINSANFNELSYTHTAGGVKEVPDRHAKHKTGESEVVSSIRQVNLCPELCLSQTQDPNVINTVDVLPTAQAKTCYVRCEAIADKLHGAQNMYGMQVQDIDPHKAAEDTDNEQYQNLQIFEAIGQPQVNLCAELIVSPTDCMPDAPSNQIQTSLVLSPTVKPRSDDKEVLECTIRSAGVETPSSPINGCKNLCAQLCISQTQKTGIEVDFTNTITAVDCEANLINEAISLNLSADELHPSNLRPNTGLFTNSAIEFSELGGAESADLLADFPLPQGGGDDDSRRKHIEKLNNHEYFADSQVAISTIATRESIDSSVQNAFQSNSQGPQFQYSVSAPTPERPQASALVPSYYNCGQAAANEKILDSNSEGWVIPRCDTVLFEPQVRTSETPISTLDMVSSMAANSKPNLGEQLHIMSPSSDIKVQIPESESQRKRKILELMKAKEAELEELRMLLEGDSNSIFKNGDDEPVCESGSSLSQGGALAVIGLMRLGEGNNSDQCGKNDPLKGNYENDDWLPMEATAIAADTNRARPSLTGVVRSLVPLSTSIAGSLEDSGDDYELTNKRSTPGRLLKRKFISGKITAPRTVIANCKTDKETGERAESNFNESVKNNGPEPSNAQYTQDFKKLLSSDSLHKVRSHDASDAWTDGPNDPDNNLAKPASNSAKKVSFGVSSASVSNSKLPISASTLATQISCNNRDSDANSTRSSHANLASLASTLRPRRFEGNFDIPSILTKNSVLGPPEMTFNVLWNILKKHGWHWKAGKGIISFHYVRPGCNTTADFQLGLHYFNDEQSVVDFVSERALDNPSDNQLEVDHDEQLTDHYASKKALPASKPSKPQRQRELECLYSKSGGERPMGLTLTSPIESTIRKVTTDVIKKKDGIGWVDEVRNLKWSELWSILQSKGWTWDHGPRPGLIERVYLAPGKSKTTAVEGQSMFLSEEAVRRNVLRTIGAPQEAIGESQQSQLDPETIEIWELLKDRRKRKPHPKITDDTDTDTIAAKTTLSSSSSSSVVVSAINQPVSRSYKKSKHVSKASSPTSKATASPTASTVQHIRSSPSRLYPSPHRFRKYATPLSPRQSHLPFSAPGNQPPVALPSRQTSSEVHSSNHNNSSSPSPTQSSQSSAQSHHDALAWTNPRNLKAMISDPVDLDTSDCTQLQEISQLECQTMAFQSMDVGLVSHARTYPSHSSIAYSHNSVDKPTASLDPSARLALHSKTDVTKTSAHSAVSTTKIQSHKLRSKSDNLSHHICHTSALKTHSGRGIMFSGLRIVVTGIEMELKEKIYTAVRQHGGTVLDSLDEQVSSAATRASTIVISQPSGEFQPISPLFPLLEFLVNNSLFVDLFLPSRLSSLNLLPRPRFRFEHGFPLVHFSWVVDSLTQESILGLEAYVLPSGQTALYPYFVFASSAINRFTCSQSQSDIEDEESEGLFTGLTVINAAGGSWDPLLKAAGFTVKPMGKSPLHSKLDQFNDQTIICQNRNRDTNCRLHILVDPAHYIEVCSHLKFQGQGATHRQSLSPGKSCPISIDDVVALDRINHSSKYSAAIIIVTIDWLANCLALHSYIDPGLSDLYRLPQSPSQHPTVFKLSEQAGGDRYSINDIVVYNCKSFGRIKSFSRRNYAAPTIAVIQPLRVNPLSRELEPSFEKDVMIDAGPKVLGPKVVVFSRESFDALHYTVSDTSVYVMSPSWEQLHVPQSQSTPRVNEASSARGGHQLAARQQSQEF